MRVVKITLFIWMIAWIIIVMVGLAHAQTAPTPLKTPAVAAPPVLSRPGAAPVPDLQPIILTRPNVQAVPDLTRNLLPRARQRGSAIMAVLGNRGEASIALTPRDRAARSALAQSRIARSMKLARYRLRMAVPITHLAR